ncbi:hypothetical protein [Yoonia sp. 208BN28-4]|uniref:hypothetical protein n=1 Tax=Yoonia sp. 208BN28-4 TaxID=3126505 RepID=UPI0030B39C85
MFLRLEYTRLGTGAIPRRHATLRRRVGGLLRTSWQVSATPIWQFGIHSYV